MEIREDLARVLTEYPKATEETFAKHPLADFLRNAIPDNLKRLAAYPERYKWNGSAGQGQWALAPWVAVLASLD